VNFKISSIPITNIPSNVFQNQNIYLTQEWFRFLNADTTEKKKVIVLRAENLANHNNYYLVGAIQEIKGVRIFGSPFERWSTGYMGFLGDAPSDRILCLKEMAKYVFRKEGCLFFQVTDNTIPVEEAKVNKVHFEISTNPVLDVSNCSEDELFMRFKGDVRTCYRQFLKKGCTIIQAPFGVDFIEEYYSELLEVFARQQSKPHYSKEKIIFLSQAFATSPEKVLCLKALDGSGSCIGTLISFGTTTTFYLWGLASRTNGLKSRPNESLIWSCIMYWKKRGATVFDMVGERDFKMKFVPTIVNYPVIQFEKIPGLFLGKRLAKKIISLIR
jgi:hypothetical protein